MARDKIGARKTAAINSDGDARLNGGDEHGFARSLASASAVASPQDQSPVTVVQPNDLPAMLNAAFAAGNIVVYRVGDVGGGGLSSAAAAVFIDEYTVAGVLVQTIALPTADAGIQQTLTAAGTSTSEGMITLSADGRFLFLTGYDAAVGTASVSSSTSAAVNRVVGRIMADGTVDTSTALSDFSTGSSPRGVASTNGTDIWVAGGAGGVRYTAFGATSSTQISTTFANGRAVEIFDGQLYVSSMTSTFRLSAVGTGLPTTAGQTIVNLNGIPASGATGTPVNSPYQFFFADLTASVAGIDTVYITDDGTGLLKYSLVSGTWTLNGTIGVNADDYTGLTGRVSGGTVTLYATRLNGSSADQIVSVIDTGGYNAAFSSTTPTVVATAAINTAFRGIAFAPTFAANTAPSGTDATLTLPEDGARAFSSADFGFTDGDGNSLLSVIITTLPTRGTLTLNGNPVSAGQEIPVGSLGNLVFTPAANANGPVYASLTFQVRDNGGTGGGGVDIDQSPNTLTFSVTAVNDAPVVTGDGTESAPNISEDQPSPGGVGLTTLLNGQYSDAADAQQGIGGSFAEGLAGVAVVSSGSSAAGEWQWLNGATWTNIGVHSLANALLLNNGVSIRFNPATDFNGTAPTLEVRLADGSFLPSGGSVDLSGPGATGGATRWSAASVFIGQDVDPVNDAPVIANLGFAGSNVTWTEDGPPVLLDLNSDAIVSDVDNANFAGGHLQISIGAGVQNGDLLGFDTSGTVSVAGTAVSVGGIQVGTLNTIVGGPTSIYLQLNANATAAAVQALIRAATYSNTLGDYPVAGARSISWSLYDGVGAGGGASVQTFTSLTVVATPDNPVIDLNGAAGGIDFTTSYTENNPGIAIGSGITITSDSGTIFGAGIQITSGGTVGDKLVIIGGLPPGISIQSQSDASIQFTGAATVADYQALFAAIRFLNTTEYPAQFTQHRTVSVTVFDDHAVSQTAHAEIDVVNVNDLPTLGGTTTGTAVENSNVTATGIITISDVDFEEARVRSQSSTTGNYGSFTISEDGHWTFAPNDNNFLRGGEQVTDTFTVQSYDLSRTIDVVITITGVNDVPMTFAFGTTGTVTEDSGDYMRDGGAVASDPDHDETGWQTGTFAGTYGTFVITNTPGSQLGEWTYTLNNASAATQGLRGGQVVADTFQMLTIDGSAGFQLSITINGVNDAATIGGTIAGDVTEDIQLTTTGTLTVSDPDATENEVQAIAAGTAGANGYGTFQVLANGNWTYTLNNALPAVQNLNNGQTLTDTILVTSKDGTDTETITVTIHGRDEGANTPPTVANPIPDQHSNEDAAVNYQVPANSFFDADGDTLSYTAALASGLPLPAWLSFDSGTRTFSGQPPQDFNGTIHLRVTASDGSASVFDDFDLIIDPVNDAPAGTDSIVTMAEDGTYVFTAADFGFTDPNDSPANSLLAVRIGTLATVGQLRLNNVAVNAGDFVSVSDINAGLLTFVPVANGNGAPYSTFLFQVQDNGGTGSGGVNLDPTPNVMEINVNAVNDAPAFVALDANPTFVENGPAVVIDANATISDIELAAAGNYGGSTLFVQRSTGADATDLFSFTGVNVHYVGTDSVGTITSNATGTLRTIADASRLNGAIFVLFNANATQADVDAVMRQLTYANSSDTPPASVTLQYAFTDGNSGAQGSGGQQFAFQSVTVNITAVNDAPVNTVGAPATVNEDTAIILTGVSIADPDGVPGDTYTVLLTVQHGTLTIRTDVAGGITAANIIGGGQGTNGLTITGTLAQINATLAAANGLTYQSDLNYNGADSLRVSSWEGVPADTASFAAPLSSAALTNASSLVTGDLNGDGKLDLVYIGSSQIGVRFGNGDGTFGATNALFAGFTPSEVVLADVDGDNDLDIVWTDYATGGSSFGSVGIRFNDGAGNFGAYVPIASPQSPYDLVTGDVNGDGRLDIIVDRRDYGLVSVLLASGAPGSFAAPVNYNTSTPNITTGITLGDFNNDGLLDIVAFNQGLKTGGGTGTVTLLLNIGNGVFAAPVDIFASGTVQPYEGTTFDLNNDGNLDLVFANYTLNDGVTVMLGNGNGTFGTPTFYATTGDADEVRIGDVNGDGIADIVTSNGANGSVAIFLGNGNGTFQPRIDVPIASGYAETPVLGDFNGDGRLDIAVNGATNSGQRVLLNLGTNLGDTDVRAITVNPVNDAPSGTDVTRTFNEDATYTFAAADFGYSDTVDGNAFYSVIITTLPVNGDLALAGVPVFAGQEVLVEDLPALVFTPAPNANGNGYASFTFQVRDNGGAANGGVDIDPNANTFTLNVTAVNDAPVLDSSKNPVLLPVNEDAGAPAGAVGTLVSSLVDFAAPSGQVDNVTDIDAGALLGIAVTGFAAGGTFYYSLNNGANWIAVASVSDASALLLAADANTRIYYRAAADFNGVLSNAITFRAWDQSSGTVGTQVNTAPAGGTSAFSSASDNASLTVNPVNDAPTSTNLAGDAATWTEGNAAITLDVGANASVGDIDSTDFSGGYLHVTLTNGLNAEDVLAVANQGTGAGQIGYSSGTVTYQGVTIAHLLPTIGSPTPFLDIHFDAGAVSQAALEALIHAITYTNSGGITPTAGTRNVAWSLYDGDGAGGILDISSTVNVVSINSAPSGTDATLTINEDATRVLAAGDFGFSDPLENNAFAGVVITTIATAGTLFYDADGPGGAAPVAVTNGQFITAADIAAGKLTYIPAANANGNGYATFTFQVRDNGGTANGGRDTDQSPNTITFNVAVVNDAPVITTPFPATAINEDGSFTMSGANRISVADVDATTMKVSLSVEHGTLTLSGIAGLSFSVGDGTDDATMTFTGTLAQVNAALNGLTYTAVANYNGVDQISIFVADNGGTGTGGEQVDAGSIAIVINPVNDAPVNAVPTAQTTNEDTSKVFSTGNGNAITVSDIDASTLTVTLSVSHGALTLSTIAGLSFGGGANGSATMTFSGTQAAINTALNGLTYAPTANYNGPDSLQISTSDNGQAGIGGTLIDSDSVSITVVSVNDAPAGANKTLTGSEDDPVVFTAADFGFSDVDGNSLLAVKITTLPGAGTLYLDSDGAGGNPPVAVTAGQFISIADINAGHLYFLGALDGFGSPYASFTFQVQDNGGTSNGGVDLDQSANVLTINLTPDNLPPVVDLNGAGAGINYTTSYTEDGAAIGIGSAITVSDPNSGTGDLIESAVVTLTDRVAGDNLAFLAPLPGGFTGVVTTNAGSITITISGPGTGAQYQSILSSIVYATTNQDPTFGGTDLQRTITVVVNDGTVDSAVATTTINIIAVNDAAVAQADAFTIPESGTITGGNLFANNGSGPDTDPDGPALSISAVNGSGANVGTQITLASGALLTVNANGTFNYNPNHAFDSTPTSGSGASNTPAHDSFTYTLAGGNTATVTITLTGLDTDDLLLGTAGADVLNGGIGADMMIGGQGNDIYIVDNAGDQVIETAGQGYDVVYTSVSYTLAAGQEIEGLVANDYAATTALALTGNAFANYLLGNAGANVLNGGAGADAMEGRGGNDIYITDNAGDVVIEAAGQGYDVVYTSVSYTLAAGQEIEGLVTSDFNATTALALTGNALTNYIQGNAGANQLNGAAGADAMEGLGGNDIYVVDNVGDLVIEAAGKGYDVVYSSVSYALAAGQEVEGLVTLDFNATTALALTGNEFANYLQGNAGANQLSGGAGADAMEGRGGNDIYIVDNAGDLAIEAAGQGYDVIYTSVSFALNDGSEIEGLVVLDVNGTAAINLTGNSLANYLIGNAGTNVLNGGAGSDAIYGGGGADTFVFSSALGATNVDFLGDFSAADDTIQLDHNVFAGLGIGALNAGAFVIGTQAGDTDDRIIYNQATGQLFYDADGNGSGAAILFANLGGAPVVSASDFVVI